MSQDAKRVRAAALVAKDDCLLLMERKQDGAHYFTLPGGGVEVGECVEDAVARELFEETSVVVKVDRELYHVTYDDGSEARYFLCAYQEGEPQLQEDSEEREAMHQNEQVMYKPQWVAFNELGKLTIYPREIVDAFVEKVRSGNMLSEIKEFHLEWK